MKSQCVYVPLDQITMDVPYIKSITCENGHKYKPKFTHFARSDKNACPNAAL